MANWREKLDVRDLWNGAKSNEITAQELCTKLANRLSTRVHFQGDGLHSIINAFVELGKNESTDLDDFDVALKRLYDWADYGHRLWIRTF